MLLLDWRFFALGSAVFAALTAILGKIGVSSLNSNLATFIRTMVILALTAFVVTLRKDWRLPQPVDSKAIGFLVASGFATGASWLCYYRALQLGPVSKVAAVDKLSVALAIFLAVLLLGEAITWKLALGALLILAGTIVIIV